MANVGHYPRALFQPAEWLPTLNEQGWNHSGINRMRWAKSTWWDQDALGKHSGPEIWEDHAWFENLGVGEDHEVVLFGIQFSESLYDNTPCLIVKVCRTSNQYQRSFGGRLIWGIDVKTHPYKRIYTDETHYTDTELSDYNYGRTCFIPINNADTDDTPKLFLEFYPFDGCWYVGLSCSFLIVDQNNPTYHAVMGMYEIWVPEKAAFDELMTSNEPPSEEFDPDFGPAQKPEGYGGGSFDYSSDFIDIPSKPQSVLGLGFVNVYKCPANSLVDFGAALFPEITWPASLSDVGEVLSAAFDSIWNSKLIDYVISVHCVPGDVPAGALEDIKVGVRTMTGILARKIDNEFVDYDFGAIHTDDIYQNFIDGYCQAELYLPFYGFISLKPEHWNGGDIAVKYRFNVIDGSFTAYVMSKPAKSEMQQPGLIGQYGGSAVVHLPVSSMSYASMFSGMVGGAAQTAVGVATGSMTMALSGAASATQASGGGDAKMSNSYNASSSFMTRRKPFLLISAPVPAFSTRYAVENGLPSNSVYTLGQCLGFTQAENAILDGIPCTADEKKRIEEYLKTGIIIKATPNE